MTTSNKYRAILFTLAAISGSLGMVSSVAALSNVSPNPEDMFALNGNNRIEGGVSHLLKYEDVAEVTKLRVGVYIPINKNDDTPKATTQTLQIEYGIDGKKCYQKVDKNQGNIIVEVGGAGSSAQITYTVPFKNMCSDRQDSPNSSTNAGGNRFFANYKIPANAFTERDGIGYFYAPVTIRYAGVQKGIGKGNSVNFRLRVPNNKVKVGPLAATTDYTNFGLRSAYGDTSRPPRGVLTRIAFGAPCTEGSPPGNVYLYDADADVFGPTYLWVTKGGSSLARNDYRRFSNPDSFITWQDAGYWKSTAQEGHQNTRTSYFGVTQIESGKTYKFIINNPYNSRFVSPNANVLSIGIPYDSIYADVDCGYTLKPTVNPPASSNSSLEAGSPIKVRGHVKPIGTDKDTHNWQLTARVFEAGDNPSSLAGSDETVKSPCSWRSGKPDSCSIIVSQENKKFRDEPFDTDLYTYDTSGLEINDQVCFVMSVQKPNSNAGPKWAHSPMKCVKISGEVVGTTVTPTTYSYYPDLSVTTKVNNDGGYPKIDSFKSRDYKRNGYEWKIIEAKFRSKPANIGSADRGGCNTIQNVAGFLPGTCRVVNSGTNLFPTNASSTTKTAASNQEGPDPIGTWTCYTTSYLKNPQPTNALRADINAFENDWNDNNHTGNPRWGDGYWRVWVPPVYDSGGRLVEAGHWEYRGTPVNGADIWNGYVTSSPNSTTPEYKFTPYRRNSCSVSGIDPKVQVRSHDLQVGGAIDSWIRTLTKGNAVGSYGSTTEYAALSGGTNARMASGSGLIRGGSQNQNSWSSLTFTNNTSTFGRFDGVLRANRPSASGAEEITNEGQISLAPGTKKIYHVNGKLTINNNLQYPNNYGLVSDIPRVIIIADTIEIGPNVTRIDPWLVAENISTCNSVTTDYNNTPQQALGEADLTIGQCSNPLIFNGPVYVSNLYLYRTGGSRIPRSDINAVAASWGFNPDAGINPDTYCEAGCGSDDNGRRYAFSAPAEVFNLRPDAYLSSLSGLKTNKPAAITDKITELPPRF